MFHVERARSGLATGRVRDRERNRRRDCPTVHHLFHVERLSATGPATHWGRKASLGFGRAPRQTAPVSERLRALQALVHRVHQAERIGRRATARRNPPRPVLVRARPDRRSVFARHMRLRVVKGPAGGRPGRDPAKRPMAHDLFHVERLSSSTGSAPRRAGKLPRLRSAPTPDSTVSERLRALQTPVHRRIRRRGIADRRCR